MGLITCALLFLTTAVVVPISWQAQRSNEADDTSQSQLVSGQHPNWVPNATSRVLEALPPGLTSTYCCVFDGGVHTDVTASIAPKGTPKRKQKRQIERRTKTNTRYRDEVQEYNGGGIYVRDGRQSVVVVFRDFRGSNRMRVM